MAGQPYEDDESIEEVRAAWNAGEEGTTSGPHELDRDAQPIVERAAARLQVVASASSSSTEVARWG